MMHSRISGQQRMLTILGLALFVGSVFSSLGGFLSAEEASAADDARPDILLILVDDLGYGDLSSYGATDLRTPAIDGLVARGLRFDNFYANCPVCSPTRAALLTGRYPDRAGVPGVVRTHAENSWGWLDPGAPLLPKLLSAAGYRTAHIGKWHLGLESPNTPLERGFDVFHGFLGDMMDDYYKHLRHGRNYMRRGTETIEPEGHATDLFSRWAIDFLREQRGRSEPFFLYLAYNAPHTPIQPPDDWLEKVRRREPDMTPKRAALVALIEHMDDGIGRVLRALEAADFERETLIIFTSDNGGQLSAGARNGPWRDGKQSVYEGGLRVPACAVWPGTIDAGTRSAERFLSMDLYPSICDAAGVRVEHSIDGVSLWPEEPGKVQAPATRDLYFTRREGGLRYGGKTIDALIRGRYKLLQNSPWAPQELYDLEADPGEKNDLRQTRPKVFRDMAAALRRQIQLGARVPWQTPEPQ